MATIIQSPKGYDDWSKMASIPELMSQIMINQPSQNQETYINEKLTRPSIPDLISQMLLQNQDKNFVQRIMKPDISPVLMDYAGPGTWGTHLLTGSTDATGKTIMYPQIVQMPGNNNLQLLDANSAREYALKNNEYMTMNSPQEVNWFGQNYKKLWGW